MSRFLDVLSSIPIEAWFALSGVLVGSCLSLVGVWLSSRSSFRMMELQLDHERKSHHANLRKERLEELYIYIEKWCTSFFGNFLQLRLVMKGITTYNQYLDQIIESGGHGEYDFARIEMIVKIYAPELDNSYSALMDERENFNKVVSEHKTEYKKGVLDGTKYLGPLKDSQIRINELTENLKNEVSKAARST